MTNKIPLCLRDEFPLLTIQGKRQCLGEYLYHCLDGRKIVDFVERGGTFYYVFEDGHELPSLCFCCGDPLMCSNPEAERKRVRGRKIVDIVWDTEKFKGRTAIYFELEFSRKFLEWNTQGMRLSAQAADQLIHPESCHLHAATPVKKRKRS